MWVAHETGRDVELLEVWRFTGNRAASAQPHERVPGMSGVPAQLPAMPLLRPALTGSLSRGARRACTRSRDGKFLRLVLTAFAVGAGEKIRYGAFQSGCPIRWVRGSGRTGQSPRRPVQQRQEEILKSSPSRADILPAGVGQTVAVREHRGKSGLHRAGCEVTPRRRKPMESATETYRRWPGNRIRQG